MILKVVQSFKSSWPRIVWYLVTPPLCNRKPKPIPVTRPSASSANGATSNMIAPLAAEDDKGCRNRHCECQQDEGPTLHRQLQCSADAVSAGAAAGDARAEHHDRAAQKGSAETFCPALAEAPTPQPRYRNVGTVPGQPRAEKPAQKHTHEQGEVPVHLRIEALRCPRGIVTIRLRG